ncbi:hypothetical protein Tco_1257585 [Tanacetum coccineum]
MMELEVPLKKKDQVALNEEMARNLEAQLQAELIKEENFELAQRLQAEEQGEITIEERSRLFVELMNRRKKQFVKLRAEEIRRKPPTKAQKRNQMSTYLKNIVGYKHSQLKSKSFDEIQKLFDKEMKIVNTFVDMNSEVVKGSKTRTEENSKRAGDELESDMSKKQKIDEHVEVEKDDQEEAEMKRHIEIVKDDKVATDAIHLATKPLVIVEYQIDKDGRMGYFKEFRRNLLQNSLQALYKSGLSWELLHESGNSNKRDRDDNQIQNRGQGQQENKGHYDQGQHEYRGRQDQSVEHRGRQDRGYDSKRQDFRGQDQRFNGRNGNDRQGQGNYNQRQHMGLIVPDSHRKYI